MNKYEIGQRVYFMVYHKPCSSTIKSMGLDAVALECLPFTLGYADIFPTKAALLAHLTKQVEELPPAELREERE